MAEWLHPGTATGPVLVLAEPVSFWGGVDPDTGRIIDVHHPQRGQSVSGVILAMPAGRGSSSSSSVLAEMLRRGTGPAGILMREPDEILVLGAIVAGLMYGASCPMAVLEDGEWHQIEQGAPMALVDAPGPAL